VWLLFDLQTQIYDYPRLLQELGRVLRPGGLVILIEFDLYPQTAGRTAARVGLPGWCALWDVYRTCLKTRNIDVDVPKRLKKQLSATGSFSQVIEEVINLPIGFFPKGTCTRVAISLITDCLPYARSPDIDNRATCVDEFRSLFTWDEASNAVIWNPIV